MNLTVKLCEIVIVLLALPDTDNHTVEYKC